jgi:hypothetical protein
MVDEREFARRRHAAAPRYGIEGPLAGPAALVRKAWRPCASATCSPTRRRTSRTCCAGRHHGPDHATPVGATPLMLAAMAGNAPLVQALLAKGADPQRRDEFGHTAWDCMP